MNVATANTASLNLRLVDEEDPVLHEETNRFDFDNPQVDPKLLEQELIDTMVSHRGVGLSACQVGLPLRVCAFGDPSDRDSCVVIFNPVIVYSEGPKIKGEEGCLSFPGLTLPVERDSVIRVRHQDPDGKTWTIKFGGYTARILQHEIDHLDGIVFTKRAKKFHLDRAKKKRKIWLRRNEK